jgi:hypothetical protein
MSLLIWVYVANATLLIVHEIDSAFWEEWKLFKIPGGIQVFLLLHIPLVSLIFYGLLEVSSGSYAGLMVSLILSLGGLFAFSIHMYFIGKGHPEFTTPVSRLILYSTLMVSFAQLWLTAKSMVSA